jgi:NTE family protein
MSRTPRIEPDPVDEDAGLQGSFHDAPHPEIADSAHLGIAGNGLVLALGAGGATGVAYTAGALWAIEEALGLDLREAPDLIVGTSAGSINAAYLRHGHTPHELAYMLPPEFTSPDPRRRQLLIPHDEDTFLRVRRVVGTAYDLAHHVTKRPRKTTLSERFSSLFPSGMYSITDADWDHQGMPREWPQRPLWVVTADLDRFERVVLRRPITQDETIDLRTALQASMALPGVWPPLRVAGRRLYDGGMANSSTHLDLALRAQAAVVVGIAPFGFDPDQARTGTVPRARRGVVAQTEREVQSLKRHGIVSMVFGPTRREVEIGGRKILDRSNTIAVAEAAYAATHERLDSDRSREFLALVREVVAAS